MKKNLISIVAIIAVALVAFVGCTKKADAPAAQADKSKITVTNNTGSVLDEMLISPASNEDDWEDTNYLEGKTLKDGESFQIERAVFAKDENYDLTFTGTDDKNFFKMDVDVKNVAALSVTKDDLMEISE